MSKYPEKEFSESPTGVEPMTFQIQVGRSNHWTSNLYLEGHGFDLRALLRYLHFIHVTNPFII